MKKQIFFSVPFFLLVLSFLFSGCSWPVKGTGPVTNKKLALSEFRSIELEIPANVTLALSDSIQGVVRAQSNIAELIEFKYDGDELVIKSSKDYKTSLPVEIVLSTRELEKVIVNGSGDVHVVNPVRGEELRLEVNGSGDISVQANVGKMRTEINGSGDITISGKAINHRIRMNGSGNVIAGDLQTENTDIRINGSGDAGLAVNSSLEAKVMGSGNIRYAGTPKVDADITGSGEISKR